MAIGILTLIALIGTGVMNRKGMIDDGAFSVMVVIILSVVAGYLGVSQY